MAIGALRAAGFAAAALGYHVWRLFTKQVFEAPGDDAEEGLRSHPLAPEVELSSFSGNSSTAAISSPTESETSPVLTPLPEQLEPADSPLSQHALQQWDEIDHKGDKQSRRLREYELSVMDHPDITQHLPDDLPAAASSSQGNKAVSGGDPQQHIHPLEEQAVSHTSASAPESALADSQLSNSSKLRSHEAILDDTFPSIRKITPVGSPEDETDSLHVSLASEPHTSHHQQQPDSSRTPAVLPDSQDTQHAGLPSTSSSSADPQPDNLQRPSAGRLARLNTTVSRTASPDRPRPLPSPAADAQQNGHLPHEPTHHRRNSSQAASTSSALSQLLHSDTQPSTGTPMARDLTEALAALASNKRLLSTMQASRSFSSPDLLSLAQQLHDSGQWPAVQDMVQEEEQLSEQQDEAAASGHVNYGTVVGRPQAENAEHQDHITSPASPTLLESHRNGKMALESLKRAREVLEMPLALRLDVLAGPAQNQSYTTDPGVTQVTVGRLDDNTLPVPDTEVSGHHIVIRWDTSERCWQVTDTGSLNGTFLNGKTISTNNRKQGREHRLSSDDMMQLGSYSKLRVSYLPLDMLEHDMPVHPKKVHTPPSSHHSSPNEDKADITIPATSSPDIGAQTIFSSSLRLEACAVSQTGREHQRRQQGCEDVAYWQVPLPAASDGTSIFCVFDGHCGRNAAKEARDLLPGILADSLSEVSLDLQNGHGADSIWEQVFLSTDDRIKSEEGCTATVLLVWNDSQRNVCLQAANVGDSAVVFSDAKHKDGMQMTADHRLTNPDERQRLADMGIHLGQDRTRLYGLNLSRCLGDKFLKDEDLGLSAHPHISQVIRVAPNQSGLIVMASDGLWDVADAHRVLQVISRAAKEPNHSVKELTEAVVQHAQRQRTRDDLTVILLRVKPADSVSSAA